MTLHPRDVGVARNRNAVGFQVKGARTVQNSLRCLKRQSVDQIEIERTNAQRRALHRRRPASPRKIARGQSPSGPQARGPERRD